MRFLKVTHRDFPTTVSVIVVVIAVRITVIFDTLCLTFSAVIFLLIGEIGHILYSTLFLIAAGL
jgi:hypothetical protein